MGNITMRLIDVAEYLGGDYGLDDYPIFDESYRETLNGNIYAAYENREIAYESPQMFRAALRRKMRLRMPYYNKLYKSELLTFDPFVTVDMLTDTESESTAKTLSEGESNGEQRSTSDGSSLTTSDGVSNSKALNLDYPQQQLNSEGTYATSGAQSDAANETSAAATESGETESTASDRSKNESEQEGTSSGKSSTKGFQGSRSALLIEYRQTMLNIDEMIVDDVRDCFLMVWDHGASYFGHNSFPLPRY